LRKGEQKPQNESTRRGVRVTKKTGASRASPPFSRPDHPFVLPFALSALFLA
jgi:hypothetical protein